MIIIIVIIIIFISYSIWINREFFTNCSIGMIIPNHINSQVSFLTKQDLQTFFKEDPDHYFHSFNDVNLHAQGYKSIDDMIQQAVNAASEFTEDEKQLLIRESQVIDKKLLTFTKISNYPSQLVASIPWRFAKVSGKIYEKGYPHTRENIIFLSDYVLNLEMLPQILVHEKTHIFLDYILTK